MYRVVVLLIKPIAFVTFSLPSLSQFCKVPNDSPIYSEHKDQTIPQVVTYKRITIMETSKIVIYST